jgi:hypothetical protein
MLLLWFALWLALSAKQPGGTKSLIAQSFLLFLLPWVRLSGYALASWLLARRRAAFAVLASLAVWLAFNQLIAGNPFYFFHAQQIFAMPPGNGFQGLISSVRALFSNDLSNGFVIPWLQFGFLPLFYLVTLTAAAIWLAKKGEWLLAITMLSILLLSHNQGSWRSVVRYDLPIAPLLCVPLLSAFTSRARSYYFRAAFFILLAGQFGLQIVFARMFHSGGWAF